MTAGQPVRILAVSASGRRWAELMDLGILFEAIAGKKAFPDAF